MTPADRPTTRGYAAVMLSDLSRPRDVACEFHPTRERARERARELNALLVRRLGAEGAKGLLYYADPGEES